MILWQGYPLSPLLFCIAEEVLGRGITQFVENGDLELMSGTRSCKVPSHTLYADDIMVFCKGKLSCTNALIKLFTRYAQASGQFVSARKSTIFAGSISQARMENIVELIGFKIGSLPFTYLGVSIFKGKPKARHLQHIADKVKSKMSAWKASLLSIAGRVQLVKSIIQSMLIHTLSVYDWPMPLIKDLEKSIRNFIWSGSIDKRKLVTVAWKKICKPTAQGGLGIRSLQKLNQAANLKL